MKGQSLLGDFPDSAGTPLNIKMIRTWTMKSQENTNEFEFSKRESGFKPQVAEAGQPSLFPTACLGIESLSL